MRSLDFFRGAGPPAIPSSVGSPAGRMARPHKHNAAPWELGALSDSVTQEIAAVAELWPMSVNCALAMTWPFAQQIIMNIATFARSHQRLKDGACQHRRLEGM
jgi:hypothetical protein